MYKVFFKDCVIFLSDNVDNSILNPEIYKFSQIEDINSFLDNINSPGISKNIIIISEDVDLLFAKFKSYFLFIEAAGGYVTNNKNQFLAIYRLGKWDLPKGMIENNESIINAAIREVQEECGISNLKIINELQNTYHTYSIKGQYILKCTYWFTMEYLGNEMPVPQYEEDIEKALWLPVGETKSFMSNTYDSIKDLMESIKPK